MGLAGCALPPGPPHEAQSPALAAALAPEAATHGRLPFEAARRGVGPVFQRHALVTAHPLATQAGLDILRAGGSAVDAAVAAQMVLGLVEPQSSGLGGGAFLMVGPTTTEQPSRTVQAWDGRETAPAGVRADAFLQTNGQPLPFEQAVNGGHAVATPGLVAMLEAAHRAHGRLPWARLFDAALTLSSQGFEVSPRLATLIAGDPFLREDPQARTLYFRADGRPVQAGDRLVNPGYARALQALSEHGAQALTHGPLAQAIETAVARHPKHPGPLRQQDLAAYRPVLRPALCLDWRQWTLCGMPPPSSGMLTIGQILGLLERHRPPSPQDLEPATQGTATPHPTVGFVHAFTQASRLAFADRDRYIADPDFVPAPGGDWRRLWDPAYLRSRALQIGPQSLGQAEPGQPVTLPLGWADDHSPELPATTHLSVVDDQGLAVSMTATVEAQFGSRVMVQVAPGVPGGFLLNNELTDFSFRPEQDGRPVANRIEPGKRPRSSMSPTLVYERATSERPARLVGVLGSPGGAVIIPYVTRAILARWAWALPAQAAAAMPHAGSLNGPTLLERNRWPDNTRPALEARGHVVREVDLTSGLHLLLREGDGWTAAVDPRREGQADGDDRLPP